MSWISLYGFEKHLYAGGSRPETAQQYNLRTISDLSAVSDQLVFGANFDYFERDDGYNASVRCLQSALPRYCRGRSGAEIPDAGRRQM